MNDTYAFAALNTALALVVMFICGCRQAAASKAVLIRVRLAYTVLGGMFLAVALMPLYGEWPRWGSLAATVGVLALLFSGSHRWKDRAPPDVRSDLMPLGPSPVQRWKRFFGRG